MDVKRKAQQLGDSYCSAILVMSDDSNSEKTKNAKVEQAEREFAEMS